MGYYIFIRVAGASGVLKNISGAKLQRNCLYMGKAISPFLLVYTLDTHYAI